VQNSIFETSHLENPKAHGHIGFRDYFVEYFSVFPNPLSPDVFSTFFQITAKRKHLVKWFKTSFLTLTNGPRATG
jgi:hypothetical protein